MYYSIRINSPAIQRILHPPPKSIAILLNSNHQPSPPSNPLIPYSNRAPFLPKNVIYIYMCMEFEFPSTFKSYSMKLKTVFYVVQFSTLLVALLHVVISTLVKRSSHFPLFFFLFCCCLCYWYTHTQYILYTIVFRCHSLYIDIFLSFFSVPFFSSCFNKSGKVVAASGCRRVCVCA